MTSPNVRTCPARGRSWVGFFVSLLTLLLLNKWVLPVQAARTCDDPPLAETETPTTTASPESTLATSPTSTVIPSHTPSLPTSPNETSPDTSSLTHTPEPPSSSSATPSPTLTPALVPGSSATPEITASQSVTPTIPDLPTPTAGSSYPSGAIMISEIAWAGTLASAQDEWIELYNPGNGLIDLNGWTLTDEGDINVHLAISIAPFSFALLERTDDNTVANIPAHQIYTGSLNNSGDSLYLLDPAGGIVDSANAMGGSWPAGESGSRASMERRGGEDRPGNWATFTGFGGLGIDSHGNLIPGTPLGVNSLHLPPPTTPIETASATLPTPTSSPTGTATQPSVSKPGDVLINELAWAGTAASASDEWIELFNPGSLAIALDGWQLQDGGDITIVLEGTISPNGYYLLERSDDQTVADIPADFIYCGSLSNNGEILRLLDPGGVLIDSANQQGGRWPAGENHQHATMERRGGEDHPGNWGTFTGYYGAGVDAAGNPIQGTPRQTNSIFFPTPQPTWIPGKVVINELLIRPHYDWEGKGGVGSDDEFIELINLGPLPVNLGGWALDDIAGAGSKPYALPAKSLAPGAYAVFFRSRTHIALNDGGDSARLLAPDGRMVDKLQYLRVRAYNLSYGRLPDGSGHLFYGLWPTPGGPNLLFDESGLEVQATPTWICPSETGFSLPLVRLSRHPSVVSRISSLGYRFCWRQE